MSFFILVDDMMMNITVTLKRKNEASSNQTQEWWVVNQTEPGILDKKSPKMDEAAGLDIYVFSDQVSPPSLGFLAGYG